MHTSFLLYSCKGGAFLHMDVSFLQFEKKWSQAVHFICIECMHLAAGTGTLVQLSNDIVVSRSESGGYTFWGELPL